MDENECIRQLHAEITSTQPSPRMAKLIKLVQTKYRYSTVLQYYLGFFYERSGDDKLAKNQYEKCIDYMPNFIPPYMQLGNILIKHQDYIDAEKVLEKVFCKKTIDITSDGVRRNGGVGKKEMQLREQIQIGWMLSIVYSRTKKVERERKTYERMKGLLFEHSPNYTNDFYVLMFKRISLALGKTYLRIDPDKAVWTFFNGLIKAGNDEMDRELCQNVLLHMHYASHTEKLKKVYERLPCICRRVFKPDNEVPPFRGELPRKEKIHIGYISPDFNKNAVGLFTGCFLKYFDRNAFNVFVYYTNEGSDEYTEQFKSTPGITWVNAGGLNDMALYNLIKFNHRIDILIDLISAGSGGRLKLMAMQPADTIINYLGYPGTSFLPQFTHRLVDWTTDPKDTDTTEELIRMPRCFLCFSLFDGVGLVPIRGLKANEQRKVYGGIMNKSLKHHPMIREAWKNILSRSDNLVLCIKQDEDGDDDGNVGFEEFRKDRIIKLSFKSTLEEYLEQFNKLDFTLDTFPYSGTTTTCTSLYMGVPVFTIYDEKNVHVSNVSTSIIRNADADELGLSRFICDDYKDYEERVVAFCNDGEALLRGDGDREAIRASFLKSMDGKRFMGEYERILKGLIKK